MYVCVGCIDTYWDRGIIICGSVYVQGRYCTNTHDWIYFLRRRVRERVRVRVTRVRLRVILRETLFQGVMKGIWYGKEGGS